MINNRNVSKGFINVQMLLSVLFILIMFTPTLFWGNAKFIGGDDTMLYYFYPIDYIKYLFNIISDNSAGSLGSYFSQAQFIPTVFIIFLLKTYGMFSQGMILGLNLAIGYLFFYNILNLYNKENKYLNIVISLLYSFSIFVYFTSYSNFFPSLFLVSVLPICIYYFLYGVIYSKNTKIIISSIIFALFSAPIINISWVSAFFICSIPILIYFFIKYKIIFLKKIILYAVVTIGLSMFFIIPTLDSVLNKSQYDLNTINRVLSNDDTAQREDNINLIKVVSQSNSIFYPLIGLFHKGLQEDFNWNTLDVFSGYYLKLFPVNMLYPFVIISTFFVLYYRGEKNHIYPYVVLSLLISIYFFTANVGSNGLNLFLFFNNNIPGFVMFRNMYDKFAITMAFYYVLVFGIAVSLIYKYIRSKIYKKILFIGVIIIVGLNIYPFIRGTLYQDKVFRSTQNINDRIEDFNSDFKDMAVYIKNMDTDGGRFLWLPMSKSNYIPILGKADNQYYLGQSPLVILTEKNDFSSDMGFFLTEKESLVAKIKNQKFDEVAVFLQTRNVEYIIVNKNLNQDIKDSYLYSDIDKQNFYNIEDSEFFKLIRGEKVRDFGINYSIYKINKNFDNKKINILNQQENLLSDRVDSDKISSIKQANYKYKINLKGYRGEKIIFLEPYHQYWKLYIGQEEIKESNQTLAYDYANQWTIDPEYIKANFDKSYYKENPDGSIDIELTLYFKPQSYFYLGIIISGTTLILCLGYLGYTFYLKKIANKLT